jgi:peptidoglycan/LPS O-acetylase OafA/YrhL
MKHSPEIQGLRAVFILAVLLCHYVTPFRDTLLAGSWAHVALYHLANISWAGVDFFFAISGFVVTLLLLGGNNGYWGFMRRRAERLLPAYFALLCTVLLVTLAAPFLGFVVNDGFAFNQIWAWGLISNVAASLQGHIMDGGNLTLLHLWSLCVEMQFYLVWPLLVWSLKDHGLVRVMLALSAAALLSRGIAAYGGMYYGAIYSITPFRTDAFALGGVAAGVAAGGRPSKAAPWLAAVLLVPMFGMLLFDPTWHKAQVSVQTVGLAVIAAGAAALALSAYQQTLWRPLLRALSSRPLVLVGDRSYSLYLWHLPFFGIVNQTIYSFFPVAGRSLTVAAVIVVNSLLAFCLAELSYRLIERRTKRSKAEAATAPKEWPARPSV